MQGDDEPSQDEPRVFRSIDDVAEEISDTIAVFHSMSPENQAAEVSKSGKISSIDLLWNMVISGEEAAELPPDICAKAKSILQGMYAQASVDGLDSVDERWMQKLRVTARLLQETGALAEQDQAVIAKTLFGWDILLNLRYHLLSRAEIHETISGILLLFFVAVGSEEGLEEMLGLIEGLKKKAELEIARNRWRPLPEWEEAFSRVKQRALLHAANNVEFEDARAARSRAAGMPAARHFCGKEIGSDTGPKQVVDALKGAPAAMAEASGVLAADAALPPHVEGDLVAQAEEEEKHQ